MSHLVPVARWFGFTFGYAVAQATACAAAYNAGGTYFVRPIMTTMTITLVLIACFAAIRVLFAVVTEKRKSRPGDGAVGSGTGRLL